MGGQRIGYVLLNPSGSRVTSAGFGRAGTFSAALESRWGGIYYRTERKAGGSCCSDGLGSGCDHELACWPGLEVFPGLADVIQPGLLQVQGELPVDGVMHQLRVGGTAHLGGRGGQAVTHERQQLVAEGGRGDRGRGPGG